MAVRVMVVEDQQDLRFLWRVLLEREGYAVTVESWGGEALRHARDEPPALIVLDGRLPDMSGWDVLSELRGDPALRDVPVVMVSGDTSAEGEARSLRLGAVRYLTKPVSLDVFVHAITEALAAG